VEQARHELKGVSVDTLLNGVETEADWVRA
jgi:hypothetical protein